MIQFSDLNMIVMSWKYLIIIYLIHSRIFFDSILKFRSHDYFPSFTVLKFTILFCLICHSLTASYNT